MGCHNPGCWGSYRFQPPACCFPWFIKVPLLPSHAAFANCPCPVQRAFLCLVMLLSCLPSVVSIRNVCVQMLLSAHEAWYQMQRYKDRFEGLLSIDRLKKAPSKGQSTSSMTADQPSSHPQPQTGTTALTSVKAQNVLVQVGCVNMPQTSQNQRSHQTCCMYQKHRMPE